jgi:regulator of sigma E protease
MGTPAPAYLNEIPEIRSVQAGSLAESMGLEGGELILKVNGQETFSWQAVNDQISAVPPGENLVLEYERAGRIQQAQVPIREFYQAGGAGWNPVIPPVVGNLVSGAPAERAGLASGDRILRINETPIGDWTDISKTVQDLHPDGIAPQPLTVAVDRGGESWEFELTPYQDSDSGRLLIGMSMGMVVQSHSLGEAIVKGSDRLVSMVVSTFTFIGQMLSGNGSVDELGGPVRIGMVIGEAAESGWTNLFFMVAVISLQLGIFNLLPIPALDGGHILMLAMEKVKGSPLSVAMRERTQMIGFSVLIMLMLFVTYNDLLQVWD